ncbi:MAG: nucleotidyltransferase domain-containing protein [Bacteroidetes bacterium]|nr:nucleotidyltransferase domain-containing protein [Bacteroidota bacterium]
MDKKTDSAIKQFVLTVANQTEGFVTAFLFGSFAKNNQRPESDIDIALIIDNLKDSDKFDLHVQLMLLASQFDSRIEPHPISREELTSDNPFAAEIRKTGKEISVKNITIS